MRQLRPSKYVAVKTILLHQKLKRLWKPEITGRTWQEKVMILWPGPHTEILKEK